MAEPGPDAVPIQKPLVYRLPTTGIMAVGGPSETLSGEALCGLGRAVRDGDGHQPAPWLFKRQGKCVQGEWR